MKYAEGTIKIKDANGQMHPFYPQVDLADVVNSSAEYTLDYIKSNLEKLEERGSIEPMNVEPTEETTQEFFDETLIAWYGNPEHDTEKYMDVIVSTDAMTSPVKVVGDTVSASVVFVNSGNADFEDARLVVPAFSNATTEQEDIPADPFQNIETTVDYTITEADVLAALANSGNLAPQNVSVSRSGAQGTVNISGDTAICLNVYEDDLISKNYEPFLTISRSSWYSANLNEQPNYTCAVTNNTMTAISNVVLASEGTGWTDTVSFAPGETKYFDIEYPVLTEARLIELNGKLTDTFTASGMSFASTPITASTSISVNPAAPSPNLSISVLSDGKSTVKQNIDEGGTVSYAVTVANTGNVTISNIAVQIAPTIGGTVGTSETIAIGTLAPGETSFAVNRSISIPAGNATSTINATVTQGNPAAGTFSLNSSGTLTIKQIVTFKFKAQTLSNKIGIPFDLYNNGASISIDVDWGDGSSNTLTKNSYDYNYTSASVHTYETAGEYIISVRSENWSSIYFDIDCDGRANSTYTTQHIYYFKNCVTEILSPLPNFYRSRYQNYGNSNYRRYYTNALNAKFYRMFQYCSKLRSIPSNLFAYNTASITTFVECFSGCYSLASIPSGLFANCTGIIAFYGCFEYCSAITSIPSGLFDDCTLATSFSSCFERCSDLQSIPSGLFDNNTAVTTFEACFYNCYDLQSIPSGLFDNNTAVTTFKECFYNCDDLQSIPSGLFDNNTAVTTFSSCFNGCSSLASIPSSLFSNNTAVTTFLSCFSGCSSLTSIPSSLFDSNTAVTDFFMAFDGCSSLVSIPSELFSNNTLVTDFHSCFRGCSSLASIPSELFSNNTAVTIFTNCFANCTSLQSIPSRLFSNNTAATSFWSCFNGCTSLASLPSELFSNNTAATNFRECFLNCTSLSDFTLHIGSSNVSTCNNFVTINSNATRTVYVPTGSTTYTTFNNLASTLGLTIIGE